MCDGNEARANLQEKLEQARRLLQQVSDPTSNRKSSCWPLGLGFFFLVAVGYAHACGRL
jgi:hypothetical protein